MKKSDDDVLPKLNAFTRRMREEEEKKIAVNSTM
jgi:hypothetical protein